MVGLLCLIIAPTFLLLVKSDMSTSPSIFSNSCQKLSGELLKSRITDLFNYNICIFSSKIEKYEVDIPKAVLTFLPIVFSKARQSDVVRLLEAWPSNIDPELPRRFPQEDWNRLFSSSYKACKSSARPTFRFFTYFFFLFFFFLFSFFLFFLLFLLHSN